MQHLDYKSIILPSYPFIYFCLFLFRIGEKTLQLKATPSINLPEKSHEKQPNKERRHINIVKDVVKFQNTTIYKSFKELYNRVKRIKLQSSVKEECEGW